MSASDENHPDRSSAVASADSQNVKFLVDASRAEIALDRPAQKNAMTKRDWIAIKKFIESSQATDARVGVLRSSTPGIFGAGGDLEEMEKLIDDTSAQAELGKAVSDVLRAMRESTIPWLAVIDGDCVGASLQLACACDARLASVRTRFGFPPARMDVFPPDHEVVQFAELFGVDGARRLLFSPQLLGFGDPMFDRIATASCEVDVIEAESDRWARHLSGLGRASVAKVKTALRHSVEIVQTRMPPEPTLAFAGPEFLGRWQALKAKRR